MLPAAQKMNAEIAEAAEIAEIAEIELHLPSRRSSRALRSL